MSCQPHRLGGGPGTQDLGAHQAQGPQPQDSCLASRRGRTVLTTTTTTVHFIYFRKKEEKPSPRNHPRLLKAH